MILLLFEAYYVPRCYGMQGKSAKKVSAGKLSTTTVEDKSVRPEAKEDISPPRQRSNYEDSYQQPGDIKWIIDKQVTYLSMAQYWSKDHVVWRIP